MNRVAVVLISVMLLAGTALAQFGGNVGVSRSGFGNVVFPGTGGAPVRGLGLLPQTGLVPLPPVQSFTSQSFASRLSAGVSGYPPFTGARGTGFGGARNRVITVPYAYPVYVGGYGYPYEQQQPNVTIVYQQPPPGYQQPAAPVVINQNFGPEPARPESLVQRYQAPAPMGIEPAPSDAQYYLIALKDHSIYSALGYWVDGDTLHYILAHNVHNQVSLDLVDRQLTEELNKDRKPAVRFPR